MAGLPKELKLPVGIEVKPLQFEYELDLEPDALDRCRGLFCSRAAEGWRFVGSTPVGWLIFERIKQHELHGTQADM